MGRFSPGPPPKNRKTKRRKPERPTKIAHFVDVFLTGFSFEVPEEFDPNSDEDYAKLEEMVRERLKSAVEQPHAAEIPIESWELFTERTYASDLKK
jgi:hypothetical protein